MGRNPSVELAFAPIVDGGQRCFRCRTMKMKMKNVTKIFLIAAMLTAFSARGAEERVSVNELPAPVQKTLEAWRAQGPVKEVVRRMVDGRMVYFIEIEKNNAPNAHLRIAGDGMLLR